MFVSRPVKVVNRHAQDLAPAFTQRLRKLVCERSLARRGAAIDAHARGVAHVNRGHDLSDCVDDVLSNTGHTQRSVTR